MPTDLPAFLPFYAAAVGALVLRGPLRAAFMLTIPGWADWGTRISIHSIATSEDPGLPHSRRLSCINRTSPACVITICHAIFRSSSSSPRRKYACAMRMA